MFRDLQKMDQNVVNTIDEGERVTSTYAEIYFDDQYCDLKNKRFSAIEVPRNVSKVKYSKSVPQDDESDIWTSPSDLLIGIIELKPPFTSKITRGRTHEGILGIGDEILQAEREAFVKKLTRLIHDNDAAWANIMEHEKIVVIKRVNKIYNEIFLNKSKIMQKEMANFYESSLQELEDHIATELSAVLIDAHAAIISDLNTDIKMKLAKEKEILNAVLKERYDSEVTKVKRYYKHLLDNELQRNKQLVDKAIVQRNDALKAFYREIEAENLTSTMYMMSLERKKCKIKKFFMEHYQDLEIKEKMAKLKEKKELVDLFKKREVLIADINKDWEDKIQKVLQIFLKFISFSLKLLPEQATFLLDLEKMVVLQLNEIQKKPKQVPSVLINADNTFKFDDLEIPEPVCKEPFIVAGDSSATIPPKYGSRETLPDDADLPYVRLQRQYVYAKCHKYEEIKAVLEAARCKCSDIPTKKESTEDTISVDINNSVDNSPLEVESSNELLLIDDFKRIQDCPGKYCQDWVKRFSFPYLDSYLDFNEENLARVEAILGKPSKSQPSPEFIDPKLIVREKLPFSETNEPTRTLGTQYSSQEEFDLPPCNCPCVDGDIPEEVKHDIKAINSKRAMDEIMLKRKNSIRRLINENPNLLKIFTDECFDFIL